MNYQKEIIYKEIKFYNYIKFLFVKRNSTFYYTNNYILNKFLNLIFSKNNLKKIILYFLFIFIYRIIDSSFVLGNS